jgi:hypothetical protein
VVKHRPPRCPKYGCGHVMMIDSSGLNPISGLRRWSCAVCGHNGMTTEHGMNLLFRGGLEYVFGFGVSLTPLTIVLSSAAIGLYSSHGVKTDELAALMAEWVLLSGKCEGKVFFSLETEAFADFYNYFCLTKHGEVPA